MKRGDTMKLSHKTLEHIESAMFDKARDIEVAYFNKDLPNSFLIAAVLSHMNKDGGFGMGLDPNNPNNDSNIYATFLALQMLYERKIKSDDDNDLAKSLKKVFTYIFNKTDKIDDKFSYFVPNEVKAVSEFYKKTPDNIASLGFHPTASLLAYALYFNKENDTYYKLAYKHAERIIKKYLEKDDCKPMEVYGFALLSNYFKDENLLTKVKSDMHKILKDKETFTYEECLMALDFDILEEELKNKVLDDIVSRLKPFMLWEEDIDWGNDRAEQDIAKLKYLGIFTVNYIRLLDKNGYIE